MTRLGDGKDLIYVEAIVASDRGADAEAVVPSLKSRAAFRILIGDRPVFRRRRERRLAGAVVDEIIDVTGVKAGCKIRQAVARSRTISLIPGPCFVGELMASPFFLTA